MLFQKQQYQTDCVNNIIAVLKKCDVHNNDFSNLSNAIKKLWDEIKYTQFQKSDKNRLDIIMETGTGKTFTYLKTIFEIHKQFGKKKFIIVVPRTAIKLGVIQNIKLTDEYFFNEYKKHLNYIDYPQDGISKINQDFINTDDFCVLITTNSAFNSDKNNINKISENITPTLFKLASTWDGINSKNPIVIIDEPHLLKGTETQKGLDKLKNSLQIRFGATFPQDKKDEDHHLSNVVYSLDSISAFNNYLVKQIAVDTVSSDSEKNPLKLIATKATSKKFTVAYTINTIIYKNEFNLQEDIGAKTGLKKYKGIYATNITKDKVDLCNKETLEIKNSYELSDEEIRQMIRQAIKNHFAKEQILFEQNIKTLSLFFIANIKDFRENDNNPNPRVKTIFAEEYIEQRREILANTKNENYKKYLQKDFDENKKLQIYEGYFSGDKGTEDKKESEGVNLILNDKEKLLSLGTPLRFIFSVWALQEGWDNPNIFNICKLSNTQKETSKRQQVGRGLRIAVNQQGNRLTQQFLNENEEKFYSINTLDMVVSGHEKDFIYGIQNEIQKASHSIVGDILSLEILKEKGLNDSESAMLFSTLVQNKIVNSEGKIQQSIFEFLDNNKEKLASLNLAEERYNEIMNLFQLNKKSAYQKNKETEKVKIRQNKFVEFKETWEKISKKSKMIYQNIEEKHIIKTVAEYFNKENIPIVTTKIRKQIYNVKDDNIETKEENYGDKVNFFKTQKFTDFIDFFVKDNKFSFAFILQLLNKIDIQKIKNNPKQARNILLEILQQTIHSQIISKVAYQFLETAIYPNHLQDKKGDCLQEIKAISLGNFSTKENVQENLLYDTICFDSEIEKDIQQNDPNKINDNKITVFAKLPSISIPTPYKNYNPDFAYLIEKQNGKKLFLIVETKGYKSEDDIPKEEQQKIDYAKIFFEDLQKELPDLEIQYKTRINAQNLGDLIKEIK